MLPIAWSSSADGDATVLSICAICASFSLSVILERRSLILDSIGVLGSL